MKFVIAFILLFFVSPCFADNFFSVLKKDQKVNLVETGNGYKITILKNVDKSLLPYKVIEVGDDYIVVEDFTGINEIRIPIYAIKSITITKVPK